MHASSQRLHNCPDTELSVGRMMMLVVEAIVWLIMKCWGLESERSYSFFKFTALT